MRILYATDGSAGAAAAGRFLVGLPLDTDCTLTILTVVGEDNPNLGEAVLSAAARTLGHSTASLERLTRRGHPAAEIVKAAEEKPTDLIVLGSHGHSEIAHFLLGSVAERVARHAPCPVLLVRGAGEVPRRVVLGVDGSAGAARAADWLWQFPLPSGCEIRLVTALPNLHEIAREHFMLAHPISDRPISLDQWQREQASGRLGETAALFTAAGTPAVTEIRSGDPASVLLDVAADEGGDVIVVGSHEANAIERFLLGSVSDRVLRHAGCSVLVVKPTDAKAPRQSPGHYVRDSLGVNLLQ